MSTSTMAMVRFKQRSWALGREVVAAMADSGASSQEIHDYVNGVAFSDTFQLPFRCGMRAEASKHGVDIIKDEDYPDVKSLS